MNRSFSILILLCMVGCADGLTPPRSTALVYLAGSTSMVAFTVGSRALSPCGRLRVENERVRLNADDWAESERIVHQVDVDDFCMEQFEVTVEQYRHCYLRKTCPRPHFSNAGNDFDPGFVARYWSNPDRYGQHPVVGVTWQGAQAYCAFRGGRLPTEIEWEYAAKSRGKAVPIVSESALISSIDGDCDNMAHTGAIALGACSRGPHAVGKSQLDVTNDGIHDLFGNASEWTADEADLVAYCEGSARDDDGFLLSREGQLTSPAWEGLLREMDQECLAIGPMDNYVGRCMDGRNPERLGFESCYSSCVDIEGEGGNGTQCLLGCFASFEECIRPCLRDGVVTVCAQRSDKPGCFPQPWCVPDSGRDPMVPHKTTPNGRGLSHIVRGGHFQTQRACEARATRRRAVVDSESTLGFRCVFSRGYPGCTEGP